ncbi:hypothetical protein MBT42_02820 [Streptomyces sp. MBT42]|uniref:hypothetical protein n=1 Tax=Streptomyces sp. MBT42 TaxID=1488373 RepID=UPI001E332575|nr:hypothetical protein [Streptomyces sp. MBT42]MCD2462486.1 hypothetical protein [Streptomyces sp. MBT42]
MTLNLIDGSFTETFEEGTTDWSILDEEGVIGVAEVVALKAAEQYGLTLERDDAYQECLILLATRHRKAREALALGTGALHKWLTQRLSNQTLTEAKNRSKGQSYEAALEKFNPEVD